MESPTTTEGRQASITYASDSETKMESPTVFITTEDKPTYMKSLIAASEASPQDPNLESRLLERAEYILQYCGLTNPGLETTLDQVRRRLRRQSKFSGI